MDSVEDYFVLLVKNLDISGLHLRNHSRNLPSTVINHKNIIKDLFATAAASQMTKTAELISYRFFRTQYNYLKKYLKCVCKPSIPLQKQSFQLLYNYKLLNFTDF